MAKLSCASVSIIFWVHVRIVKGVLRVPHTLALLVWFAKQLASMCCHHVSNGMGSCNRHALAWWGSIASDTFPA